MYFVVFAGPLGAGKTSLMLRYIYDTFEDKISRFVSEEKKSVNVDNKEVVLDIWDTAGESYSYLKPCTDFWLEDLSSHTITGLCLFFKPPYISYSHTGYRSAIAGTCIYWYHLHL